jgi:hypothetical protein
MGSEDSQDSSSSSLTEQVKVVRFNNDVTYKDILYVGEYMLTTSGQIILPEDCLSANYWELSTDRCWNDLPWYSQ